MANWRPSHTTKRETTPYYESSFNLHLGSTRVINAPRGSFSLMELNAHSLLLFKLVFTGTTQTHGTLLRLKWAGFAARRREENFWKEIFKFPFMLSKVALQVVMHTQERAEIMISQVSFLLKSTASRFFQWFSFPFSFVSSSHFFQSFPSMECNKVLTCTCTCVWYIRIYCQVVIFLRQTIRAIKNAVSTR